MAQARVIRLEGDRQGRRGPEWPRRVLDGRDRAKAGQWMRILRRTERGTFRTAFEVQAGPRGTFSATLPGPGTYKVRWNGIDGPTVRAR